MHIILMYSGLTRNVCLQDSTQTTAWCVGSLTIVLDDSVMIARRTPIQSTSDFPDPQGTTKTSAKTNARENAPFLVGIFR